MQEFSPFDLLFGREVCGTLKLLKKSWLEEDDQVSLLEQVSQLQHRIKIFQKRIKHGMTEELERDPLKLV